MQDLGRCLEKAKCKLALAVDFNLADLFRFFGVGEGGSQFMNKAFIDCNDVVRVARYLKVMPSDDISLSL